MEEQTNDLIPDSEDQDVNQDEQQTEQPSRTVPLEALEAERRKRQDLEAQNRALQDLMIKSKAQEAPQDDSEDEEDFVTKAEMKERLSKVTFAQKREVLEEAFVENKPEAIQLINEHLEGIIKRKPWLAPTIDAAPNRYARAYEIVQDYMPQQQVAPAGKFSRPQADAKRIIENSQKPGNPSSIAKAANSSNVDYLKSIQGKPEFRDYRRKMRAGD